LDRKASPWGKWFRGVAGEAPLASDQQTGPNRQCRTVKTQRQRLCYDRIRQTCAFNGRPDYETSPSLFGNVGGKIVGLLHGGSKEAYVTMALRYIFDPGQRRLQDFVFSFKCASLG
jgi:hypothetical protein